MPIETQTGQAKKKLVEAVRADLEDDAIKHLTAARETFQALSFDARGVDKGLVTACTGWGSHLDKILHEVQDEVKALTKRMGGGNGHPKITEHVDGPLVMDVVSAKNKATEVHGV